jgi:hypothetical protein
VIGIVNVSFAFCFCGSLARYTTTKSAFLNTKYFKELHSVERATFGWLVHREKKKIEVKRDVYCVNVVPLITLKSQRAEHHQRNISVTVNNNKKRRRQLRRKSAIATPIFGNDKFTHRTDVNDCVMWKFPRHSSSCK